MKDFYASFKVEKDHVTVQKQLDKVYNKVMDELKKDFGDVIPKLSKIELSTRFDSAIQILDREGLFKK
jgi:hypothetical protein